MYFPCESEGKKNPINTMTHYIIIYKKKNQYIIKSNGVDIETNPFKFLENTRTKNFQIRINL
jgi:hypothetical protein